MTQRILAAALLFAAATGCSPIRAFEGAAKVHGGYDGPAGEDVIFLELRNVKGLDTGAYGLVLPGDWTERPVAPDASGRLVPEPPVVPTLRSGTETSPALELRRTGGRYGASPYVHASEQVPLLVVEQKGALDGRAVLEEVETRLDVGASAYVLVRPEGASAIFDASLFGARLLPVDAVSQGDGPLQWIFLGDLVLEDERGWLAKSGDLVLRQTPNVFFGTVEAVVAVASVTAIIWIWFVI